MNIGERIKIARKSAKITQKELAALIGVTTTTIQNYENGRREPNYDTLENIAKALKLDLLALIDITNNSFGVNEDGNIIFKNNIPLNKETMLELIKSLYIDGNTDFQLIDDDLDYILDSVRNHIYNIVDMLTDKNSQILSSHYSFINDNQCSLFNGNFIDENQ